MPGPAQISPKSPRDTYVPARQAATEALRHDGLLPHQRAARAAVPLLHTGADEGEFLVPLLGVRWRVHWPHWTVAVAERPVAPAEEHPPEELILLHYLHQADGTPLSGQWVQWRQLPGALALGSSFDRVGSGQIAAAFGRSPEGFSVAAEALGAMRHAPATGSAYIVPALPRVPLLCTLWPGDEEIPASAGICLDASAAHYLPAEDLVVLKGLAAQALVRAARSRHGRGRRTCSAPGE